MLLSLIVFLLALIALLWSAPGLDFYLGSPDHGYQLSLGHQIVLGKFPFVDFFFHYGPLTAYTSCLNFVPYGSLVFETIICATGYALAIMLVFYLTRCYTSTFSGCVAGLIGFLLLARFYKWYYWLFPLLALFVFSQVLNSKKSKQMWWMLAAGIFDGLAALYRLDLGLACASFHLICFAGLAAIPMQFLSVRHLLLFCVTALAPICVWLILLGTQGGYDGISDFFGASLTGAKGAVEGMSVPLPHWNPNDPLTTESQSALLYILTILTYVTGIITGFLGMRGSAQKNGNQSKFLMAASILGLALFPQALHRADFGHLQQVLPPAIITAGICVSKVWNGSLSTEFDRLNCFVRRLVAVTYLGLIILVLFGMRNVLPVDLASWNSNPLPRYRQLAKGIDVNLSSPLTKLVAEIRKTSTPDDCILVAGNAPQLYFLANRRVAGIFTFYVPGVFSDKHWNMRDIEIMKAHSPLLVIAPKNFMTDLPKADFKEYRPDVYAYVRKYYPRIVYDDGSSWMILAAQHSDFDPKH